MNKFSKNALSTKLAEQVYEAPDESDDNLTKEIVVEYTEVRSWMSYFKSILKWTFFYVITLGIGGKASIEFSHYIADLFGWNYATVWINLLWLLIFCIGCNLYRVNPDRDSETGYEKNFTPAKAIFLIIRLLILCGILLISALAYDNDGILKSRLNRNENEISFREENTHETQNMLNDIDDNTSDGMYFRD